MAEGFRSLADKAAKTFESAAESEALYQRAISEMEAIERAAVVLDGCGIKAAWDGDAWLAQGDEREALDKAAETLASIAKERP